MVGPQGQQTQLEQSHAKKGAWKKYWDLRKVEETRAAPQSSRIQLLSKLWSICKDRCTESGAKHSGTSQHQSAWTCNLSFPTFLPSLFRSKTNASCGSAVQNSKICQICKSTRGQQGQLQQRKRNWFCSEQRSLAGEGLVLIICWERLEMSKTHLSQLYLSVCVLIWADCITAHKAGKKTRELWRCAPGSAVWQGTAWRFKSGKEQKLLGFVLSQHCSPGTLCPQAGSHTHSVQIHHHSSEVQTSEKKGNEN